MRVRGVVVQLEMDLNDFITIVREASMERVSLGEFIRKCIQQYLDEKYAPKTEEEKHETKK